MINVFLAAITLAYGSDPAQTGDLHLPIRAGASTPVAIVIHGGGWSAMSRKDFAGVADFLSEHGCAAYNIDYRLASPENPWPACGDDCLAAARFVLNGGLAGQGLAPKSVWLVGGSAGGHLALWTGFGLPREQVSGIVSISGIADSLPDALANPGRYKDLFGGRNPAAGELAAMSIVGRISGVGPRVLLTHAKEDSVVPFASANNFAQAYAAVGGTVRLAAYSVRDEPNTGGHAIWRKGVSSPRRLLSLLEREIVPFMGLPEESWKLVADLSDDFDGSAIDAAKWWDYNPSFFGRDSVHFAFSPDNVKIAEGMLRLTAREMRPEEKTFANVARGFDRWCTATVKSRRQAKYGYFECRARAMRASVCNAFWLYDPLSGDPVRKHKAGSHSEEIDIFEMCGKPRQMPKGSLAPSNVVMMTFHRCETPYVESTAAGAWQPLPNKSFQYVAPFDIAGGFHRYGLLWTEDECVFYVDGVEAARRKNDFFHQPLHVMLDCETIIFGEPDPTDLPATFDIDWVRVWQREK